MKRYAYKTAQNIIDSICQMADEGHYDTRNKFMAMVDENPHIAVQGYNIFGKIFFWNTASSDVYGYRESEAINQDLVELILPPEMQPFARTMLQNARKSGRMPDAAPCDLVHTSGNYITVYSGHLVFSWGEATTPEFYCIDLPLETEEDIAAAARRP
jgi:PAS domain S-box-containing protein